MAAAKKTELSSHNGIPDAEKEAAKKERYYGSQKELLKNLSQLRSRIHCDRQLAERDNFLKRASQQVSQCKSILQEKWSDSMKSMKRAFRVASGSEELDFEQFSEISDFAVCCQVINHQLMKINAVHEGNLFDSADICETQRQLLEKEVLLSFYGQYNAGKSTLINAILQNKFLPVKRDPETSFRLKIQPSFNEEFTRGPMQLLEELELEKYSDDVRCNCLLVNSKEPVANGAAEIYRCLQSLNKTVRQKLNDAEDSSYVLKVQIPLFLQVPEGWHVSLMDNPGYDEYTAHVTDAADQSLKISSACLYVTTYDQYRQKQVASFFKKMYEENKEVFLQRRLIVVVNKLDLACGADGGSDGDSEAEDELSSVDVVNKVHSFIQEVCDCESDKIPKDIVIPVYGLWAYRARMLAKEPKSQKWKDEVVKILSNLKNQPAGQGEPPGASLLNKHASSLSEELERCSNILELERRLQKVAKSCITVWVQKVQNDYSRYLHDSRLKLKDRREALAKFISDKEADISCRLHAMTEIYKIYREIIETTHDRSHDSPVWKNFQDNYNRDAEASDPRSELEDQFKSLVADFKDEVMSKVKTDSYGPRDFVADLKKIVVDTSSNFDKMMNIKCCFPKLLACRTYHLNKVTMSVTRMMSLMEKLYPAAKDFDKLEAREAMEGAPLMRVPKFMEAVGTISAPNVCSSLLEKIIMYCKNAIKSLREFTPMAPFKAELLYSDPFLEDDHRESGQSVSDDDVRVFEDDHDDVRVFEDDHDEVRGGDEEEERSDLVTCEDQVKSGERELDSTEHREGESTTAAVKEEDAAEDIAVLESDSPDVVGRASPKDSISQTNNETCSEASATPTKKIVTTTPSSQDSIKHKTPKSPTYRKWLPEMGKIITDLQESIEKEIQIFFGNFKAKVVQEYWNSYCNLALKKLEAFNEMFDDQLKKQTVSLNQDIDDLLHDIEKHKVLTYHIHLVNFMIAQFSTMVDKYLHTYYSNMSS